MLYLWVDCKFLSSCPNRNYFPLDRLSCMQIVQNFNYVCKLALVDWGLLSCQPNIDPNNHLKEKRPSLVYISRVYISSASSSSMRKRKKPLKTILCLSWAALFLWLCKERWWEKETQRFRISIFFILYSLLLLWARLLRNSLRRAKREETNSWYPIHPSIRSLIRHWSLSLWTIGTDLSERDF